MALRRAYLLRPARLLAKLMPHAADLRTADRSIAHPRRPLAEVQLARQIRIRHIAIQASMLQVLEVLQRKESSIGQNLLRQRRHIAAPLLPPAAGKAWASCALLRHPLRHDEMIFIDRHFRRVAQRKGPPRSRKKTRFRIGARQLFIPALAQLLQPPRHLPAAAAASFSTATATSTRPGSLGSSRIAWLLPLPHAAAATGPAPAAASARCPAGRADASRLHPRRVDRHLAPTRPSFIPRHLQHLREHIVQSPARAAAETPQRPVIRPRPSRQIAQRQILPDAAASSPPRRREPAPHRHTTTPSTSAPDAYSTPSFVAVLLLETHSNPNAATARRMKKHR